MKTFEDEVRSVIENNTAPAYDKEQALRLYVEQGVIDGLIAQDMNRYREALELTGGSVGDIEPISRFHEVFQGTVDIAYAAAVVGLETEVFLEKIRENIGLQNIGLLVLVDAGGSMKRDAWTEGFDDVIFELDFPETEVESPSHPDLLPGTVVHIPDTNLHAAIAEALGKSPSAPIIAEEMERLRELEVPNRGIQDLTGLQFATNLNRLILGEWWREGNVNQISDLSPIAGLINLRYLRFDSNPISDISPLRGLKNLTRLEMPLTLVFDLSPIAGLTSLERLNFGDWGADFEPGEVSDLSPIARLVNLKSIQVANPISDLSPFAKLTKLEELWLYGIEVSNPDLSPLAGLTGLKELHIVEASISDISPLAGLTGLTRLGLPGNNISDVSPLAGLTQLKWLSIFNNKISDFSPLDGLRENTKLIWHGNPGFPKGGAKIEGPWLWVMLPDTELSGSVDLLSEASVSKVTEVEVATHGTTEGGSVGDSVWTFHRLPPAGEYNIEDMLKRPIGDGVIYGVVSFYSPREQNARMYVGALHGLKVWLNGDLVYERLDRLWTNGYTDYSPVTLKQGRNILLAAVGVRHSEGNAFLGFEPVTEYTVTNPGVGYTLSKTPIHIGDTFTLDIGAEDVFDMAGWQFDVAFDPAILEALNVIEGDFLKTDGGTTFFQGGSIDNAAGKITGLSAARLSAEGVTGTGSLLQVNFKAKSGGETKLTLQTFEFGAITGENIPAGPHEITFTVEGRLATGYVNRDGRVSILDLILVSQQLGKRVPAGSAVDVNGDGVVSILDLITVSGQIGNTTASAAPPLIPPQAGGEERVDAATVAAWIAQARLEDDGSLAFKEGIENLEKLLASLIPKETALLANYPNPFNPDTWIPYQLAESAEVTLTIYDMNGEMVRHLAVGYQAAGMYRSRSRAAYWDGRNQLGESVASGLYFYTLTTGEFTATRRMLILK